MCNFVSHIKRTQTENMGKQDAENILTQGRGRNMGLQENCMMRGFIIRIICKMLERLSKGEWGCVGHLPRMGEMRYTKTEEDLVRKPEGEYLGDPGVDDVII
jgi:hypothetical protein